MLVLSCIGLDGVLAYAVTRRTSKIGIRMALGATKSQTIWMILQEALLLTVGGIVLGIAPVVARDASILRRRFGASESALQVDQDQVRVFLDAIEQDLLAVGGDVEALQQSARLETGKLAALTSLEIEQPEIESAKFTLHHHNAATVWEKTESVAAHADPGGG